MRTVRLRGTILISCAVLASVAAPSLAASGSTAGQIVAKRSAHNRAVAEVDARRRLALIRLPPGAVPSTRRPTGVGELLTGPPATPAGTRSVTAHAFWTVPIGPRAVLRFLRRHPPRRAELESEYGGTGGPAVEFAWRHAPRGVWSATAMVTVVGRAGGGSGVRIDAFDWWELPRPLAARIPAGARFLEVKVIPTRESVAVEEGPYGELEAVETRPLIPRFSSTADPAFVRSLARLVNRQPAYQYTALPSCGPGSLGVTHTIELIFKRRRDGRPVATVSQQTPIGPCDPLFVHLRGAGSEALYFGWNVLRRVHGLIQRAKAHGETSS